MKKIALILLSVFIFATFSACGGSGGNQSADLAGVMEKIQAEVAMDDMMALTTEDLEPNYGIDPADARQFAGIADITGIKADEIVLFEGKDADAAKRIKERLDARYDQKCIENIDYLPAQYDIIKQCSVKQDGVYVSMIISPDAERLTEIYRGAFQ